MLPQSYRLGEKPLEFQAVRIDNREIDGGVPVSTGFNEADVSTRRVRWPAQKRNKSICKLR
jgi:hypothetical protein